MIEYELFVINSAFALANNGFEVNITPYYNNIIKYYVVTLNCSIK